MIIAGAARRDDARHHPLRPRDDRVLRGPGRDLRAAGRAAHRRRPGHRLHRRDQRPDPVRDHAHPDQGRPGAARLPDAGRPGGDRRRSSSRSSSRSPSPRPTGARSASGSAIATEAIVAACCSRASCCRSRSSACCCSPPSSAACSSPSASRAARRERLARRLPDPVGDPLRDRHVRVPRPAQRDQHADVDRADAQRGQPLDRRVRRVHPGARAPRARSSR